MKMFMLIDGQEVVVIGQGIWYIGEQFGECKCEVVVLCEGIELGMMLIDIVEMYVEGGVEDVVGVVIVGCCEEVFLVSKVYLYNVSCKGLLVVCECSLCWFGCEIIDFYLLYWQGWYLLEEIIEVFEWLCDQGKILCWGVFNFDLGDMYELDGSVCVVNQVMYNLEECGIEYDLLFWCQECGMLVMVYCLVGQGGRLLWYLVFGEIVVCYDVSSVQVVLVWLLEQGVIVILKVVMFVYICLNVVVVDLELSVDDLWVFDQVFLLFICK